MKAGWKKLFFFTCNLFKKMNIILLRLGLEEDQAKEEEYKDDFEDGAKEIVIFPGNKNSD
jgi:hypothetical protein